ncbi:MAG TPA: hypothetical protein VGG39_14695 [Polyangiaceae bacterium]|jgi:hypothetical protein
MALPSDIARISALGQPVLRNLYITQRYHDLSRALAGTIGGPDVNWSTFATWASKTAGQSIRNEEVPPFVVDLVNGAGDGVSPHLGRIESLARDLVPGASLGAAFLLAPIRETLATVSDSIAAGNLEVFAELAPQFARFVQAMQAASPPTPQMLAAFLEPLDPRPTAEGGQSMLRSAFTAYHEAILAKGDVAKARLILLGNCQIGLHEQTRLQPQIQQAMDAPIDDILRKHLHANLGGGQGLLQKVVDVIEAPFADLVRVVRVLWERVATRTMMTLALPGGAKLALGQDIPKLADADSFFPPPLVDLSDPDALVALIKQYDRARGVTDQGSASVDWRRLDDRMNFIVNLFRSRQQTADLLGPPFSDAQRALIEKDEVPGAALGPL